jgi:hypothetical protein
MRNDWWSTHNLKEESNAETQRAQRKREKIGGPAPGLYITKGESALVRKEEHSPFIPQGEQAWLCHRKRKGVRDGRPWR